MKHGEKMKRLLAVFLALAMAWSGSMPGSGLSLVQATETDETTVEEESSTNASEDSTAEENSEEEAAEDEDAEPSDESEEESIDELTEEETLEAEAKKVDGELLEAEAAEEEELDEELEDGELEEDEEKSDKVELLVDFNFEDLEDGEDITGAKATEMQEVQSNLMVTEIIFRLQRRMEAAFLQGLMRFQLQQMFISKEQTQTGCILQLMTHQQEVRVIFTTSVPSRMALS